MKSPTAQMRGRWVLYMFQNLTLFLLVGAITIVGCKMNSKTFTSQNGWFTLTLPANWDEYDDGEDDTYAFFNSKSWTGNFRITPFRWTQVKDSKDDKAAKFIAEELAENDGAVKKRLGDFECAYYKKELKQDGDSLVVYHWAVGKKDNLFICSFTINKDQEFTKQNKTEFQRVEDIIKSIKIN
jgi:hypothetical protein